MNFQDILKSEQQKIDSQQGNNEKVEYPKTKHKRLFFDKNERQILMQVLPAADLVSAFGVPSRRIFLSTKSSNGKDIKSNFVLDAEPNPASILEQKVNEWSDAGTIPNGFGGQTTPKKVQIVNAVRIYQQPDGSFVQERDQEGNLVVRVFEMPFSGYSNFIRALQNPMYNVQQRDMSFMDINAASPIEIHKPAQGQMEYPVNVYTNIVLPPLGNGWEGQLEDLEAHAVPTERLVNGEQWVKAFIDMKEGRKPNQGNSGGGNGGGAPQQPQNNPYGQQPQTNPYGQQPGGQFPQGGQNPYGAAPNQPVQNTYQGAPAQPQNFQQQPQQGYQQPQQGYQQPQQGYQQPESFNANDMETSMESYDQQPQVQQGQPAQQPTIPAAPSQPTQSVPSGQPAQTAPDLNSIAQPSQPAQPAQPAQDAVQGPDLSNLNGNGLSDIDSMIAAELNEQ